MDTTLDSLKREGVIQLWLDYRGGTSLDYSGNGRHATNAAGTGFSLPGLICNDILSPSVVADATVLRLQSSWSIVFLGSSAWFNAASASKYIFAKEDAGGRSLLVYAASSTSTLSIQDGAATRTFALSSLPATRYIGISSSALGATPVAYTDYLGFAAVNASGTVSPGNDDAPLVIGGHYSAATTDINHVSALLVLSRVLTATEHSGVYQELSTAVWPLAQQRTRWNGVTLLSGKEAGLLESFDLVNRNNKVYDKAGGVVGTIVGTVADVGPGGLPALYFNGASRITTAVTAYAAGTRTFSWWSKSSFTNANYVFSHGNVVTGSFFFNNGAIRPLFYGGGGKLRQWEGSTQQDDGNWHHWVLTMVAGVEDSQLYCDGVLQAINSTTSTGFGVWGALNIGYTTSPGYFTGSIADFRVYNYAMTQEQVTAFRKNVYGALGPVSTNWGVPVSSAVRGGTAWSYLENSDWQFRDTSGRWKIVTDTIGGKPVKALQQTTGLVANEYGGVSQVFGGQDFSAQQRAYGTFEWSMYSAAANTETRLFAPICAAATLAAGNTDSFRIAVGSVPGTIRLELYVNGATLAFYTADNYLATGQWYRFRLTRIITNSVTLASQYTMWIRGGAFAAWTQISTAGGSGSNPYALAAAGVTASVCWMAHTVALAPATNLISLGAVDGAEAITWKPVVL